MRYFATVKKLGITVEEEVILSVNGVEITCFVGFFPFKLKNGGSYVVEFDPVILDDYHVVQIEEAAPSIERIGNSFSHYLKGRLVGNKIDMGSIQFEDDILLSHFGYLDGKFISWKVDRIEASFPSEE